MITTETERINNIVSEGAKQVISDRRFLELEIMKWKQTEAVDYKTDVKTPTQRGWQLTGNRYFNYEHDILRKKRMIIGENGRLVVVDNLPNNRIMDNQYAKMVDQKTNYLVGSPLNIDAKNKDYAELLKFYFDKNFFRKLKAVTESAINQGLTWLCPYYDTAGALKFKHINGYELKPFWADSEHTILDCAVHLYPVEVYKSNEVAEIVEKVDVYSLNGIDHYILDLGRLTVDPVKPHSNYISVGDKDYNWAKLPLIPFKANHQEIPLIKKVKFLQDGINTMLSDFEDRMQEDTRNSILVLENFDGTDLGEFRRNLSEIGVVKVQTSDGGKGGLSALTVEFKSENYQAILNLLKRSLIENAKGYDAKDDRLSGNPNQMNIQSMYSDIDLDANGMEIEFQAAFDELAYFVDAHIFNATGKDFSKEEFIVTFNRNVLMNNGELIDQCKNSIGLVSTETILSKHPFVTDVEQEMSRMAAERQASIDNYAGAFGNQVIDNASNPEE